MAKFKISYQVLKIETKIIESDKPIGQVFNEYAKKLEDTNSDYHRESIQITNLETKDYRIF